MARHGALSLLGFTLAATLSACGGGASNTEPRNTLPEPEPLAFQTKVALGEALYNDTNLSLNRTQSCATCHNPDAAFIDDRLDSEGKVSATSLGDDALSFGDRNTPTAAYAAFTPEFGEGTHSRFNSQQPDYTGFVGGQFIDGRATDLQAQAEGPFVNPKEMGMPDEESVVLRVKENSDYLASFTALYGDAIFDDINAAYSAVADAIAEFEKTDEFAPFSSKYDKSLRGEYTYDPLSKAAQGKALFFSQQFTNCATCHQLRANSNPQELFTNFEYHNIGVPSNTADRTLYGLDTSFIDNGLLDNELVTDAAHKGKFKVPTLRNVAVTAPYMHNGVFKELSTVIKFYDHFLTGSEHTLNPETGLAWAAPEVPETVSTTELVDGNKLDESEVEALVCFLHTLTDERYEPLIPDNDC